MLNTSTLSPPAPVAATFAHLSIARRMQLVIERVREQGSNLENPVALSDFQEAPETCGLEESVLRANIGEASLLIGTGEPEPTYDRAARVHQGTAALLSGLPTREDLLGRLKLFGFSDHEAGDLLGDILSAAAPKFAADRSVGPGMPDWGRDMVATNAD